MLVQTDSESDITDSESEFSESEEEDVENVAITFATEEDFDQIAANSQTGDSAEFVVVATADNNVAKPEESVSSDDHVSQDESSDVDDVPVVPVKKTQAKKKTVPAAKWNEVVDDNDEPLFDFDFKPHTTPGVSDAIDENCTVLEVFSSLFTDEIQDHLVKLINKFAAMKNQINNPPKKHSVAQTWVPVTKYELVKFIAVFTAMGLDKRPWVRDYWSQKSHLQTPWYAKLFSRSRFEAIFFTMLHAGDVGSIGKEKVEPFVNKLCENFQANFYPFQNLAIDEMVVKWKGRWKNKQYNPAKPAKYHIKTFGLCDSATGYAYNLLTYYGSQTSYNPDLNALGQSEKVFEYLLRPVGEGHHVFADRYYTTHNLITYLSEKKLFYTGTLMGNRKNFPPQLKQPIKHLESKYFRDDNGILACAWKDKKARKPVLIVSTRYTKGDIEVQNKHNVTKVKPLVIHEYNASMNGCDHLDQMISYYNNFDRQTKKWWKRIFVWILEDTQMNSYIIHTLSRPEGTKLSLKDFKEQLIQQLEEKAAHMYVPEQDVAPKGPGRRSVSISDRLSFKKHLIVHDESDRNCVVCSAPGKRKRTSFRCTCCDGKPYLHPKDCFYKYHTGNN